MTSAARPNVATPPPERPLMIYDGDCGFCRSWIARWNEVTGDLVDYAPYRTVANQYPEIPLEDFKHSVQLIETSGEVSEGAEAVFRALAYVPRKRWLIWAYRNVPAVRAITEWVYWSVARHRKVGTVLIRCLWGDNLERPRFGISRWVFLRLLGAVYFFAFASLWVQIEGLIGSNGILPVAPFLDAVRAFAGPDRYWRLPTLCWLNSSDAFLHTLCGAGTLLSALLILGAAPAPCLILLWCLYLSLTSVCREFLGFQWDALLLEAGFLAIFFAPLAMRSRLSNDPAPSPAVLWLLRWLLFRLMFSSGAAKLASGDPTWRNLTALRYHYETQPLPTWIGWYAHQSPEWFQRASVAVMFFLELVVPFFIFAPRRVRLVACGALISFQLVIAATGNYAFFNFLAIVLCVPLVDDLAWPKRWRERIELLRKDSGAKLSWRWPGWVLAPLGVIVMLVTTMLVFDTLRFKVSWPDSIAEVYRFCAPFRVMNHYGLFAVMTTSRPEIIVEGSDDGLAWLPYEFKWKPGDLKRAPAFVAPHQPRLDWQMWFAALGYYEEHPFFMQFLNQLLRGSPQVLALLQHNPFPEAPPRYVRALVYDYHFSDRDARRSRGVWWRREFKGSYCPVVSLSHEIR